MQKKYSQIIPNKSSVFSQKEIFDVPQLKISAPKYLCSLFQDINELFSKIVGSSKTGENLQFFTDVPVTDNKKHSGIFNESDIVDHDFIEIQQKYRRLVSYIGN